MCGAGSGACREVRPDLPPASPAGQDAAAGRRLQRAARWLPGAIVLAVCACFAPVLNAQFVNWDDASNLVENPFYRGLSPAHLRWMFTTFHGGHYQPLTWVTFAIDYALWGMQPRGYHVTNVVLHTANALLVYALAVALLPRAARRSIPRGSATPASSSRAPRRSRRCASPSIRCVSNRWRG